MSLLHVVTVTAQALANGCTVAYAEGAWWWWGGGGANAEGGSGLMERHWADGKGDGADGEGGGGVNGGALGTPRWQCVASNLPFADEGLCVAEGTAGSVGVTQSGMPGCNFTVNPRDNT